jgi:hypothetical protein
MKIQLKEGLIVEAISIEGLLWDEWYNTMIDMVETGKDIISTGDVVFDGSKVFYRLYFLKPEISGDMIILSGK